ncbi:MAG TPA: heavy metal sensor histidine kinase, partial [Ramlibacter sp.]
SFAIDVEHDVRILDSLAVVLVLTTLAGAAAAALLAGAAVRRGLQPLRMLTRQTERISVGGSGNRLGLARPVEELQPWIAEFNSLLDRMERSYARLEAFNADVAHELRTPLTALIGKTELALSRTRGAMELGATLEGNLEELQRISTIVNDMLFLSRSDRGAAARLAPPMGLRGVAQEVAEFHEAAAGERHLTIDVVGDVEAAVDESLLKRALSNLLENATRHARPCTVVRVLLADATGTAMVCVENEGPQIPPRHLPHLFDRFYRAEVSRESSDSHHGLGLAIVAAIARMHGGSVFADSDARRTRVGLTIPRAPAGPRQARPHETRMTAMSSA